MRPAAAVLHRSRRGLLYGRRGVGRPIMLVHGWCLDRTLWCYLEASLVNDGFTVVTPALAGYGASADLEPRPSLDAHGDDLADLLAELGMTDAVVCGFAFGAAALGCIPPQTRIAGLISIGMPSAATADYPKMQRAMLRDWPLFAQRSAAAILGRSHSDATLSWLGRIFEATPLPSALTGADLLAGFEPMRDLPNRSEPYLFLHGADDVIVPPMVSEQCASQLQGDFHVVEDAGHLVVLDAPQALHDQVAGFARSLDRAGSSDAGLAHKRDGG